MKMIHEESPEGYYFTDTTETMFFKSVFIDKDDTKDLKRYHLIKINDADKKSEQIKKRFKIK